MDKQEKTLELERKYYKKQLDRILIFHQLWMIRLCKFSNLRIERYFTDFSSINRRWKLSNFETRMVKLWI